MQKAAAAAPEPAADLPVLAAAAAAAAAGLTIGAGGTAAAAHEREVAPGVVECWWHWHGHCVRYLRCGASGPAAVCVHGFCANADHWRHNLPALGQHCRVYALDLLGGWLRSGGRSAGLQGSNAFMRWSRAPASATLQQCLFFHKVKGPYQLPPPRYPHILPPPGFGYSDKPCPVRHQREPLPAATSTGEAGLFTFHTWSRQLRAFIKEVVGEPAVLLCNSGGWWLCLR